MLVTLWVFIGIEGASVYSARAKNRSDIGKATVIGFAGVLGTYILVSVLSTGILTQKEFSGLKVPAMAGVFAPLVGNWGAAPINLGLVVSVGGALRRDPLHVRPRRHVHTLVRRGRAPTACRPTHSGRRTG